MILRRDFETKTDKEQEKRFLETSNISMFIEGEETLERIDTWSWFAIRKIIRNKEYFENVEATFGKWNKSIDELIRNMNIDIKEIDIEPSKELIKAIENRNIFECRKIIESFNKNELFVNAKNVAFIFSTDLYHFSRISSAASYDHINMKNVLYENILSIFGGDYQ